MKKEFVITDFMDLPRRYGSRVGRAKQRAVQLGRKIWHACLPSAMPRRVRRTGTRFVFDKRDWFHNHVLTKGWFEPAQVLYFFNAARKRDCDIFLDIGANFGYYSLQAAKTGDFAKIYAVEAHPGTYRHLLAHIAENSLDGLITPYNIAASDKRGELFIDDEASGNAAVSRGKRKDASVLVQAEELDSFFDFSGRSIAVKIDVEGHEIAVLDGMKNLLSRNRVLLQAEIWPEYADNLNQIAARGLRVVHYEKAGDFYFVNDKGGENE